MAERVPVLISIMSSDSGEDGEPISVQMPGTAEIRPGDTVLRYTEYLDPEDAGTSMRTEVTLRARPGYAVMQRKGAFGIMMIFETGQRRGTLYHTPYGDMPVSVRAKTVETERTDGAGSVRLIYELALQGGPSALRTMVLTWRETGPC